MSNLAEVESAVNTRLTKAELARVRKLDEMEMERRVFAPSIATGMSEVGDKIDQVMQSVAVRGEEGRLTVK